MLANKRRIIFTTAVLTVITCLGTQAVWGQAKQPQWKDRAEFDLYDSITKEADNAKRLEKLETWKKQYPQSEFASTRLLVYLATYGGLGRPNDVIATGNEILTNDPNDVRAMSAMITALYSVQGPSPEVLSAVEKASTQLVSNADTIFAADKKLQGMTDDVWAATRKSLTLQATNTVGYIAMLRKDNEKAEEWFKKGLGLDPSVAQISYWLGGVIVAQKKPEKQSEALFHFARAAAYDGPGALPDRKPAMAYFEKAYTTYHGSKEGIEKILELAKSRALPPADFHIKDRNEILKERADEEERIAKENPMAALWKSIKTALTGDDGPSYFNANMKDALLPGGVNGVNEFKGKLVSFTPATSPKELVLSISDPAGDVTIKLDAALPGKMEPGAEISFQGVASGFTKEPFMVTFDVEKAKIKGWTAIKTAPTPKKAGGPVRKKQ